MKEDYLIKELHELYSFVRTDFSVYITWYTIFTTVNFAAIGWLLLKDMSQNIVIVSVCAIFMSFQNILGIWGSISVQKQMKSRSEKALLIGEKIDTQQPQIVGTLLADGFYEKIFRPLIAGLTLWLIFWIAYPFILF
ncbi:membrane protein [Beggiatoa sp. PS]|nr:membrane protein [Beggiatoa sp. PS]